VKSKSNKSWRRMNVKYTEKSKSCVNLSITQCYDFSNRTKELILGLADPFDGTVAL